MYSSHLPIRYAIKFLPFPALIWWTEPVRFTQTCFLSCQVLWKRSCPIYSYLRDRGRVNTHFRGKEANKTATKTATSKWAKPPKIKRKHKLNTRTEKTIKTQQNIKKRSTLLQFWSDSVFEVALGLNHFLVCVKAKWIAAFLTFWNSRGGRLS